MVGVNAALVATANKAEAKHKSEDLSTDIASSNRVQATNTNTRFCTRGPGESGDEYA